MNDYNTVKLVTIVYLFVCVLFSVYIVSELYNNNKQPYPIHSDEPVIIWNDDHESIPMDGSLVRIEMTVNDTIYLSPN
jgi:hypothetical protein